MTKTRDFYFKRAVSDFRDLVIYFNITRPQHNEAYFKDGKFSREYFNHQIMFLNNWNKMSKSDKKYEKKKYAKYSSAYNYTFGIPRELAQKVAGVYRDENGVQHKIPITEIESKLVKEGFMKVANSGRKFKKDKDGNYSVKCWWCKKYIMVNSKQKHTLMNDERYSDLLNYGSKRLKKIVFNWFKSETDSNNTTPEQTSVKTPVQVKNTVPVKTPTPTPTPIQDDLKQEIRHWIDEYAFQFYKDGMTPEQLVEAYMSNPKRQKVNGHCPFTAESLKKYYDAKIELN